MANILAYIELVDDQASWASLLTLRLGRHLATRLGATLYAVLPCASPPLYGDNDIIAVLSRQGADKVILMTHAGLTEPALFQGHGDALLTAASQFPPALLLIPQGPAASDVAPRVAARLGALFVQEPLLEVEPEHHLVIQQPVFGGTQVRRFTTAELEHAVVAVVTPDPQRFSRADGSEEAEVVVLSPVLKMPVDGGAPQDVGDFTGCLPERVVLVGESVHDTETWDAIRSLAARLGATLRQTESSASRGLAPDVAVIGPHCPGGLPGFVLTLGVGKEDHRLDELPPSNYLIAVHPDRETPLFARAKLALATEVLPAVREMLEAAGPRPATRRPEPEAPSAGPSQPSEPQASPEPDTEPPSGLRATENAPTMELPVAKTEEEAP